MRVLFVPFKTWFENQNHVQTRPNQDFAQHVIYELKFSYYNRSKQFMIDSNGKKKVYE